jgi:hypothetical protein
VPSDADAEVDTPPPDWLIPKAAQRLTGEEHFSDRPLVVADFWRWAFSDLRTNIVRGILAEFLVARAVGDIPPLRTAWDSWDVTTAIDIKVESSPAHPSPVPRAPTRQPGNAIAAPAPRHKSSRSAPVSR